MAEASFWALVPFAVVIPAVVSLLTVLLREQLSLGNARKLARESLRFKLREAKLERLLRCIEEMPFAVRRYNRGEDGRISLDMKLLLDTVGAQCTFIQARALPLIPSEARTQLADMIATIESGISKTVDNFRDSTEVLTFENAALSRQLRDQTIGFLQSEIDAMYEDVERKSDEKKISK